MINAYAIDTSRKESAELLKQITNTAESLALIDTRSKKLLETARARVIEVVGEPKPQAEASGDAPKNGPTESLRTQEKSAEDNIRTLEKELVKTAVAIHNNALMAADTQAAASRDNIKVGREKRSEQANQSVVNMNAVLTRILALKASTHEYYSAAERTSSQIEMLATQITETQRLKEERETREREEQLQNERLAADKKLIRKHEALMLALAASFMFEDAAQQIESEQANYQTDAGRKRYQIITEQCSELLNMKNELIRAVSIKPFTWGWRQDGTPRDIDKITVEGPIVGGRVIPWSDVSLKQSASILNVYITGPEVKPKTRSDYCIAAALYFHAKGRSDIAKTILDTGIAMRPSLRPKATRLTKTIRSKQ